MSRIQKKVENKLSIQKLIFFCIVTTIIVTALTLSKYESSVASSDNTKVATAIMNLSSEMSVIPVSVSPLEKEKEYIFKVSNIEEEKSSEVSMEYTLKIENLGNLPLDFELYTYDEEKIGNSNLLVGNGNITDKIEMKLNDEGIHTYKLKIKWREGENSYLYSQTIDYVRLVLKATQID